MNYGQGEPAKLRDKFWQAMEASPFVMLQLDRDLNSAAPMTAQLDRDANHEIWFFTSRDGKFANLGEVNANFSSKGHDVFARFRGVLTEETSQERLDQFWSNMVAAWFPGGKSDPNPLLLSMKLGDASVWVTSEMGMIGAAKMMLGMDVREDAKGSHAEIEI